MGMFETRASSTIRAIRTRATSALSPLRKCPEVPKAAFPLRCLQKEMLVL
jgi:hypothetical protein